VQKWYRFHEYMYTIYSVPWACGFCV